MATTFLGNAFSLSMLASEGALFSVDVRRVTRGLALSHLLKNGFTSVVGHESTANVLATVLDLSVPVNRVSVSLKQGDVMVVAQYNGPRLAEGATVLPEGATMEFLVVRPVTVEVGAPFGV